MVTFVNKVIKFCEKEMHVTLRKNMLISLFISEGLGHHQWQVKVSTKLIIIKTDSSFQSASELDRKADGDALLGRGSGVHTQELCTTGFPGK